MSKRINWVKMDQIKALYEKDLNNFREKYEKYSQNFSNQEILEDLKKIENNLKNTLSTLNNYKSLTIHNIEKNDYIVSKTLLFYFDEKDKEIDFLKGEYNALLSKIYSKIHLISQKEKEKNNNESNKTNGQEISNLFQISNTPCSNVTSKEKAKRFFRGFSFFRFRYLQLVFWAIIIALILSIFSVLINIVRESNDKIQNFEKSITMDIMGVNESN